MIFSLSFAIRIFQIVLIFIFLFLLLLFLAIIYHYSIQIEPTQTQANLSDMHTLLNSYIFNPLRQISISIRRQSSKVNIFMFLKIILKLQIIAFRLTIVLIDYFFTSLSPLISYRTHVRLHSETIETKTFGKFVYPEFIFCAFATANLVYSLTTSKKYHWRRPWVLVSSRM